MMHDDGKNCGQQTRDENARTEDRRRDMGGLGDSRENGGRAECKETTATTTTATTGSKKLAEPGGQIWRGAVAAAASAETEQHEATTPMVKA